jgi:hypothetical protein
MALQLFHQLEVGQAGEAEGERAVTFEVYKCQWLGELVLAHVVLELQLFHQLEVGQAGEAEGEIAVILLLLLLPP